MRNSLRARSPEQPPNDGKSLTLATSERGLVAVLSTALVLTMTGFMPVAAVLPAIFADWGLTETEAGWLNGVFFGGYAAGVPLLLPLTDRMDARRVIIGALILCALGGFGFAFLADGLYSGIVFRIAAGIGLAGIHFPGMKLITDRLDGPVQQRGSAVYISMFSIGGAMSFISAGVIESLLPWKWVFTVSGICAVIACSMVYVLIPPDRRARTRPETALLDFRPVLRNGPAMRYVVAFFGHVWEVFAFRGWSVALLVFSASLPGNEQYRGWNMAILSGATSFLMMPASVGIAELANRFGRVRVVTLLTAATTGVVLLLVLNKTGAFPLIVVLMVLYFMAAFGDTASLAGGIVAASVPEYRGATLAVYALSGFLGGMLGPVTFGIVLDLAGGRAAPEAWTLAFCSLIVGAAVTAGALHFRRRTVIASGVGSRDT